jgi:hypothetical protein
MTKSIIREKSFDFAIEIIKLTKELLGYETLPLSG